MVIILGLLAVALWIYICFVTAELVKVLKGTKGEEDEHSDL